MRVIHIDTPKIDKMLKGYGVDEKSSEKELKVAMRKCIADYHKNKMTTEDISGIAERILYGYHKPPDFKDTELLDLLDDVSELFFNETNTPEGKFIAEVHERMREFVGNSGE